MELLQGEPLSSVMRREQRLSVPTACEYTGQILQALEAAHALGVIHRDLKPDNVFVTFQGGKPVLKLIDFGIAKLKTAQAGQTKNLTVAGMLMGTPEYMAPEQAYSADKVDVRADVYAVGVMLYEMLAGKSPVSADDPRVLILKVERGEAIPLVQAAPGIKPEIAGFVHRAMAPRPELRFASATEMRLALEEIVSGKRMGTSRLAATPGAPAASEAPRAASSAMKASDPRTGTVPGAPMESALTGAAPVPGGTVGAAPLGGTVGAAPLGVPAMGAPRMQPAPAGGAAHPHGAGRKKGGSGLVIALALVALLLGAGAVVAYVLSTQPSEPAPPPPLATLTPPPPAVAPPPVTPVTPVTPLTTSTVLPPAPGPAPQPRRDAGGPQPQPQDAGAPTPVADAGGQTTIVTPFGTFQFPGPRPPFYPPDQPWPPPTITPLPTPPP
jgi:serine/threonine-protein kinase